MINGLKNKGKEKKYFYQKDMWLLINLLSFSILFNVFVSFFLITSHIALKDFSSILSFKFFNCLAEIVS